MSRALIFIADGTEEIEFTIAYDTLTRAGIQCTSALVKAAGMTDDSSNPLVAVCSRGVKIIPDTALSHVDDPERYDILIVPGGAKGSETISQSPKVQKMLRNHYDKKKLVAMICAGSLAAKTSGLPSQRLTSHPSVKTDLEKDFDYSEEPVVVSYQLITSRGPGTAFPFALKIVEIVCGKAKRDEVEGPMVFPSGAI